MRQLHLLRHAKASWELAGELDYERGLTGRGLADCELMRDVIAGLEPAPELVLCSGARRTRETLEAVASALPNQTKVIFDDRIYQATTGHLVELLKEVDPAVEVVLMVGHNPSCHDLAVELAADGSELQSVAGNFPTAALASLEIDGVWSDLDTSAATLTRFVRPKSLRR